MFNLVIVLMGTFIVAGILIYFISAHDRRTKLKAEAKARDEGLSTPFLDWREFSKVCMDLCDALKLDIADVSQPSAGEIALRAASRHPITRVEYLVAGFWLSRDALLDNGRIMELSDQIVSERISKGIVVTTGRIDRESALRLPELAPIEFIDGERLAEMMKNKEIFS